MNKQERLEMVAPLVRREYGPKIIALLESGDKLGAVEIRSALKIKNGNACMAIVLRMMLEDYELCKTARGKFYLPPQPLAWGQGRPKQKLPVRRIEFPDDWHPQRSDPARGSVLVGSSMAVLEVI